MAPDAARPALTTLIVLFTDLEGSTLLWQQYPQAMQTALARHDEIIRTAVERANGRIIKSTGDGFYAVFDNALEGLDACISAQKHLTEESWPETGPLRVRMGLHAGEAQARGDDYFGTAVNRASRLMSAANGGQVLLSAAAAEMVAGRLPDGVSLRDLGEHRLKDLLRPEHIFQLVHPGLPADFPPIASLNRQPNNLPMQPSIFVGRETELDEIKSRLMSEQVRLLTLTGPGGTGKTRLALQSGAELSDRFIDGTYFIDLAPVRDPDAVVVSIARTIGLDESSNGSMLADLKKQMGDKQILLLLDNFEQVTAAGRQLVDLLQYCPRLKMLATSREALHVRGEHLYPVPPLSVPEMNGRHLGLQELARFEAVQLFLNRAQAVKPDFELTAENAAAVAELCLHLDGLPLAIELAAARIRHFSPQALRQRLGSRLNLLRGGARDLPERQQTLRDTIDWSYELLSEQEQNLFAVLSVFAGCTFEAAEAVASESVILAEAEVETLEAVESLVDKSLLRILDDGTAEPRLRMLETIREYAGERLQENPDRHEAVRRAHAAYFSDFTQEQRRRLTGYEREKALEALAAEFENLQIAWQYWAAQGDFNQLQKMVDGLWMLYEGRGWYQGMVELTTELLEVLAKTPSAPEHAQQEIMLRTTLARALMAIKGFTPEVEESFKEALVLSEGLGEIPQLFPVLRGLSTYYQFRMDFEKAAEMGERILVLAESRDDDSMRLHAYLMLGSSIGFFAGIESGLKWLDKGITLFDPARQRLQPFQIGNSPGIVCYTASALYLLWLGLPDKAIKRAEKAVELATRLEHPYTKTYAYFHTGILFMWYGDLQRAQKNALAMREIAAEYEYHLWHALATILLGALESLSGQTEGGLARLEEGIAAYAGHITPPVFWPMLTVIRAAAYGRAGKPAEGVDLLDELLGEGSPLADLMLLKGELLLQESASNAAEATGLLKQSLDISQIAGNKLWALQAATNLARLELRQGQVGEGSRVLAELYSSFSEGFETVDLQVARALLDELAGET
ncbi:MAG: adenylate/guanylate cyclase domain-containing protein [Candidatus Promineifilaceae bacterium]